MICMIEKLDFLLFVIICSIFYFKLTNFNVEARKKLPLVLKMYKYYIFYIFNKIMNKTISDNITPWENDHHLNVFAIHYD